MLRCPTCGRTYTDESIRFCLNDGISLVDAATRQSYTLSEARSEFGISWIGLIQAVISGKLRARRIGRQWRFKRSDLQEYLQKR